MRILALSAIGAAVVNAVAFGADIQTRTVAFQNQGTSRRCSSIRKPQRFRRARMLSSPFFAAMLPRSGSMT